MTAPTRDPELEGFLALSAARLAPRTVEAYRRDLEALARWLGRPPSTVTTEELERYLAELRAQGLSGATIARRVASLRSYFRHLVLIGAAETNPAAELDLPRRTRRLPRALSPSEAERFTGQRRFRLERQPIAHPWRGQRPARAPRRRSRPRPTRTPTRR